MQAIETTTKASPVTRGYQQSPNICNYLFGGVFSAAGERLESNPVSYTHLTLPTIYSV